MPTKSNTINTISPRPPVVVVVGHIDHGKSTLLDYIRKSNITAGESGGITQHLGAYEVEHKTQEGQDRRITFLDTPGHEAFGGIRRRGAKLSDLAILIVSAEEGVKPQTLEALKALEESQTPFIVAINKIDRPNSNPQKIIQELAENNVLVESWGGKIPSVEISAKTGQGIDDLLEVICLMSDLEELTTDTSSALSGVVLETNIDPKTGPVITAVIKDGALKTGDIIGTDGQTAKIKKIENDQNQSLKQAVASTPVKIYGFNSLPDVGSDIIGLNDKKTARAYEKNYHQNTITADPLAVKETKTEIPLVIKSDTAGSLEAALNKIEEINAQEETPARLKVVLSGYGSITDGDLKILLGSPVSGLVIGFNVKEEKSATDIAERHNITIATFDIIYELLDWLAEKLQDFKIAQNEDVVIGQAKILKCFNKSSGRQVAGGEVIEGSIKKKLPIKITRDEEIIGRGKIFNLEVNKSPADEIPTGTQFGIMINTDTDLEPGDIIISIQPATGSQK